MTEATDTRPAARADAPAGLQRGPDFGRPLAAILGLPFDLLDVAGAVARIRAAAFGRQRCFVSTPNLNFAVAARQDAAFRGSVLRSDLCLVDGMPLVWAGRLTGVPVTARVSGADVFEALVAHPGPPVTVFLFGGPPGAGEAACAAINRRAGGVRCVGHDTAGFGSVASMSEPERIERINRSGAQFVVVSLGAAKGQAWIEHNADRLCAPVLSHLGAVVNFAAGSVQRAPDWMQRTGLEWLWRVREEPGLWRRYWGDGRAAAGLLLSHVLPDAWAGWRRRTARRVGGAAACVRQAGAGAGQRLTLSGDWSGSAGIDALRDALRDCVGDPGPVRIELGGVDDLGHAALATLLVARGWFAGHGGLILTGVSPALRRCLQRRMVLEALCGEGSR